MQVVVELKSDVEISGILDEADRGMNLIISAATQVFPDGTTVYADTATVNGPSIRCVHIPPKVKLNSHMSDYIKKIDRIKSSSQPHAIKNRAKPGERESNEQRGADIVLN